MANPIIATSFIYAHIPQPCYAHAFENRTFRVRIKPTQGIARYLTQAEFELLYQEEKGTEWYELQMQCFHFCKAEYLRRNLTD
ncbi:hypothetical protein [Niabella sp.]|uniref:hypothetical protein n=1 Tax=Niabella sp. TaxID=1962976 RepID=UPI00262560AC|nr:hypothetical protein [Niabella sp.]